MSNQFLCLHVTLLITPLLCLLCSTETWVFCKAVALPLCDMTATFMCNKKKKHVPWRNINETRQNELTSIPLYYYVSSLLWLSFCWDCLSCIYLLELKRAVWGYHRIVKWFLINFVFTLWLLTLRIFDPKEMECIELQFLLFLIQWFPYISTIPILWFM